MFEGCQIGFCHSCRSGLDPAIPDQQLLPERREHSSAAARSACHALDCWSGKGTVEAVHEKPGALVVHPITRAAAEIEPEACTLSSSCASPGPMRAPDASARVSLTCAIQAKVTAYGRRRHKADGAKGSAAQRSLKPSGIQE